MDDKITLYHNTSNDNAVKINKEGIIAGLRKDVYGKGSEAEGLGIWCTTERSYGYGGATITFNIDSNDEALRKQNDTEYIVYRNVKIEEIADIDLVVANIHTPKGNLATESYIPKLIDKFGKEKVLQVFKKSKFVYPYDYNKFINLIETGNKYCKGTIKLTESKKLIEVSRNEMLATSKAQTYTRYQKASGYKGFSIYDIDTTSILTTDSLRVTCKVGDYWDTVEMENILYWIQYYAELQPNNQVNARVCTQAIMDAIDAMDIKVDCTCADMQYRFAYKLSKMKAKYGKQETRPAKIRNPNDYGYLCKHLIAMLSNKKWLQQVSGTLMDFVEKRIVEINRYLRVKPGEELTLPNELARQNAKKGFYTKLFKNNEEEDNNENSIEVDNKNNNIDNINNNIKSSTINNVQGNNPSTNKVNSQGDVDNE